MEADSRRRQRHAEREAMRRHRELQRYQREHARESEKQWAAYEVQKFENYLELLVSLHKDLAEPWNWRAIANAPQPSPPQRGHRHEAAASEVMRAYKPGFVDQLFGAAKKHVAQLEVAVAQARAADHSEYDEMLRWYRSEHAGWNMRRFMAGRILAGEISAYPEALEMAAAFDELAAFGTRVTVAATALEVIELACEITDAELVPEEEIKLTSTGKLTKKSMAAGRYWALYQDHVCSCAIRAASETFAVLPVERVIVNIGSIQVNTSTGHRELVTFLAVHFARGTLAKLNLNGIDPSDSMKNFQHRMKFKKTSGFEPVTSITQDDHWVTT